MRSVLLDSTNPNDIQPTVPIRPMCFGIHLNTAGGDTIFIHGERGDNAVHISNTDHSKIFVYFEKMKFHQPTHHR